MRASAGVAVAVAMGLSGSAALAQAGDVARGQRLFNQQCRSCHTIDKGGANAVGPNLHGLFGRNAGTAPGFAFSEPMINSQIVWTDKTLADYCADPRNMVPGTSMVFGGVKQKGPLADLVAFLEQATK
jgi:cytochrome c